MGQQADVVDIVILSSDSMFWRALERTLSNEPGFRVHWSRRHGAASRAIRKAQPSVLLVDISTRNAEGSYRAFVDKYPKLTVIGLHPETAETIVRLHNIGRESLLQFIRAAATHQSDVASGDRFRVLAPEDIESTAVRLGLATRDALEAPEAREEPRRSAMLLEWLDLIMHLQLASESMADDTAGTPGWTLSARGARALLDARWFHSSEADLTRLLEAADARLFGTAHTVHADPITTRFLSACDAFELEDDERRALLLGLAPELDGSYARVFGFLNDDLTRRRPTPTIMAKLLFPGQTPCWVVRERLSASYNLGLHSLLRPDPADPLPGSEVGVLPAPEITAFLLADSGAPDYPHFVRYSPARIDSVVNDYVSAELVQTLRGWADGHEGAAAPVVQLVGEGLLRWFETAVVESGRAVVSLDLSAFDEHDEITIREACLSAARVTKLHDAILLIEGRDALTPQAQQRLDGSTVTELRRRVARVAVHSRAPWLIQAAASVLPIERPRLDVDGRIAMWRARARARGIELPEAEVAMLAATVRFEEPQVDAALRLLGCEAASGRSLQSVVRRVARSAVPGTVRRVESSFGWSDIVLPPAVLEQLRAIASHVRHAGHVLDRWDYRSRMPYGQAVASLFTGPSGTGKTMAARVIASELGVELFQVDLSRTVSKYIGETEKHLDEIFDAAERASAVLLFDEADALFGKRTEVRDAHDRYANVEVAYLLQRMESYSGLAILTTNFRKNLDTAFLRRLRFVVEFAPPSASERQEIWRRAFPPSAPLAGDVDFRFLAGCLEITGGNIQQIAIRAAFLAVAHDRPIVMADIIAAAREELRKLGMLTVEKSLAELAA